MCFEPGVWLVLDTIRQAMKREKKGPLWCCSSQRPGLQYTSQAYGITPSMAGKGDAYDNAMAENFFSILKTGCIYRHKLAAFTGANEMIDRYIHCYSHERIQSKTGEAPLARHLSY